MHQTPLRPLAITALGLTSAALVVGSLSSPSVAAPHRGEHSRAPVVVAHLNRGVALSTQRVHAGTVDFRVRTHDGSHTLQIARVRSGYSFEQAGSDLQKAFGGDVAAINRVDDGVVFLGGASARPGQPGRFVTHLGRGTFVALDQDSNAVATLKTFGTPRRHPAPATNTIGIFTYGFGGPAAIAHRGMTWFYNQSDQPHFVTYDRVKPGTTNRMVRNALQNPTGPEPAFILPGGTTQTGVITNGRGMLFRYDLKPGRYLMACWWPDDETGMPHAMMGMWRLITLR